LSAQHPGSTLLTSAAAATSHRLTAALGLLAGAAQACAVSTRFLNPSRQLPHLPAAVSAEWDEELVAALTAVADASSLEEGKAQIPALLDKLGDPFTRWLPPK
jgi:hypothetical protein